VLILDEQIRLLVRWYGMEPESAAEIIVELRDRTSLRCLTSGYRARARAVEANKAPGLPPTIFLVSNPEPESPSAPGDGLPSAETVR
jgi:hypothetical protein